MTLTLEITSPPASKIGGASRCTFGEEGGSIGRDPDNSWVLPQSKVSGRHAVITCHQSVYYIEDRSRNGVCLNSSQNRLVRGRPYPLESGDRILIDPYEIEVSISGNREEAARQDLSDPFAAGNPFGSDDPFAVRPDAESGLDADAESSARSALDPLALLGIARKETPARKAPSASDLEEGARFGDHHFGPPAAIRDPSLAPADPMAIPESYNPLAPDDPPPLPPPPAVVPRPPKPRPDDGAGARVERARRRRPETFRDPPSSVRRSRRAPIRPRQWSSRTFWRAQGWTPRASLLRSRGASVRSCASWCRA